MNTPEQFNAAYYASLHPEILQVMHTTAGDTPERISAMEVFKDKGYIIDRQIMIHGYDPYKTMWARRVYGYPWVDSLDQNNIPAPPGYIVDGKMYDPNHPPATAILVPDPDTCDLAKWYPPIVPPVVVTPKPAPAGPFVGAEFPELSNLVPNAFHATPAGEKLPTGKVINENGASWTKGLFQTFATMLHYFTKN